MRRSPAARGQWPVGESQWQTLPTSPRWPLATGHWPLALALVACLLPTLAHAQTRRVEILNADLVEVTNDASGLVRRLTGAVRLRQDTTSLWAASAVYDETRSLVTLTGDVRIVSGRDTLTAAEVVYDAATKVSVATGRVRVGTPDATLFAPEVTYDSRAEVSSFAGGGRLLHRGAVLTMPTGTYSSASRLARTPGPVTLTDSTGTLTARRGTYDTRGQRADFGGDVRLRRDDAALDADSVVYFRRTERARAYGRVALERIERDQPRRRTFLFGETLVYDGDAETARVRGSDARDPLVALLQADDDGTVDTTLARAPRLDAARVVTPSDAGADTTTVLTAAGGARFWSRRLAAVADSLHLTRTPAGGALPSRDALRLRSAPPSPARPRAWADGAQLTADTLDADAEGGSVRSLLAVGRAFTARVDSAAGRLQQIAGGRMLGRFRADSLRSLSVWPNAEVVAWRVTSDSLLAGAERLSADSLAVRLVGGEIREVAGIGGIAGTSYGPSIAPEGVQLPGFAFDPDDAPTAALLDGWEADWLAAWRASHPDGFASPEDASADDASPDAEASDDAPPPEAASP